jgi:predicted CxxxxCH...CXXCH cytochrome family protein
VPFLSTDTSAAGLHHQTATREQFDAECAGCHTEADPAGALGPACTTCHLRGSPLASGMTAGTCLSCHQGANFLAAGPAGDSWPDVAGAHPKHLQLPTFTRTSPPLPARLAASALPRCEACHAGSVPGDPAQLHYRDASRRVPEPTISGPGSVSIDATFNALSGKAKTWVSPTSFTCTDVSCHGGQRTPEWLSGALDGGADACMSCHELSDAQYDAPTGRHLDPEEHQSVRCEVCHDMHQAKPGAENHFKYLDTPEVSGASIGTPVDQYPSDTMSFGVEVTGDRTYTVTEPGNGRCSLICHEQVHTPDKRIWRGGGG